MRLIGFLWLIDKASPGSARLAIIGVPIVMLVMFMALVFGGESGLDFAVDALLAAAGVAIALLPVLGLLWVVVWILSLFPDRAPRSHRAVSSGTEGRERP